MPDFVYVYKITKKLNKGRYFKNVWYTIVERGELRAPKIYYGLF